ncbi:MAG: hypothetical protein KAH22_11615 [Thiotrichaceae bacterium]|nr:hypothetical protein [Thiotrichaceae bacterium]
MHGMVPNDPQSSVSNVEYAVVYAPRLKRKRFPSACVEIMADQNEAVKAADPSKNRYAAQVHGPSKSSEGQYIYYLLHWL